jgi:uncharacterized SAM-binding protein YcdF (DUF218 family)
MEWLVTNAVAAALIPPGCLVLLGTLGALLMALGRRRLGVVLVASAFVFLYALSTHFVADGLLNALEPAPADPAAARGGHAIVVLGGGTYFSAPEYGQDTVSSPTLVRLRFAAHLHRRIGKPLLVSGGAPHGNALPEAELMKQALERDFGVPVQWIEPGSNNTMENARRSYRLLGPAGVTRIYLVTHARHMPRARLAFERAGFSVIAAPTGYATRHDLTALDFLPDARALLHSRDFFHEVIGIGWYHLRLWAGR